jgi:hypothetical protein
MMPHKPIPIPVFVPSYGEVQGFFVEDDTGGWYCVAIGEMTYTYDEWCAVAPASRTPALAAVALLKLFKKIS